MSNTPPPEPIAVIGTACRFPGNATTPSKLWSLLHSPTDLLTPIPPDRFSAPGYHHPSSTYHGHTSARAGYFLSSPGTAPLRVFDARFFGINASEAGVLDPQVRLLLETVYEAVEAAGGSCSMDALRGSDTAVFAGCMLGEYERLMMRDEDTIGMYHATGTARAIVANRVSHFFDWRGASMTVDTACSSSLVAVHLAAQQLRNGGSEVAVVVGANLILDPQNWLGFGRLGMLSKGGRSRMWDEGADGYGRGEGVAAVVLKRLSLAERDGDEVEFVIREVGVNQDGRTQGLTTPSASAQANLIRACYKRAGLDLSKQSDRPQFFEAHGTGTPVGDPIEAEAIASAFFPHNEGSTRHKLEEGQKNLYVGSIKSVIGHTEGTAGLAALLKAGLAIQSATIPPNMHFNRLNPKIEPFYSNLEVPRQALPWPQAAIRRASVNCFGFGGANCHAIIENYTPPSSPSRLTQTVPATVFAPFVFSASSKTSLINYLAAFNVYLKSNPNISLPNLSYTLSRRSHLPFSTTLTATSHADLLSALSTKLSLLSPSNSECSESAIIRPLSPNPTRNNNTPTILAIFTGQGAQHAGMASSLLTSSPRARAIIASLDARLARLPASDRPTWTLLSELQAPAELSHVSQAEYAQPLCTAIQILQVDMLRAAGLRFSAVVGHSSGEIAAAYAARLLTADEAICVAYYRGLCVASGDDDNPPGAMMAVESTVEDVQGLCGSRHLRGKVAVAAVNSERSVTVSGEREAVERMRDVLGDEGKFARVLRVDRAYHHGRFMGRCGGRYRGLLEGLGIRPKAGKVEGEGGEEVAWYSSVYEGRRITGEEDEGLGAQYWVENLTRPVLFMQAVRAAAGAADLVVEVGPHPALQGPVLHTLQASAGGNSSMATPPPYVSLLRRGTSATITASEGIGLLCSHLRKGQVDLATFERFMQGPDMIMRPRLIKGLPTYAWDHDTEYWHESRYSKAQRFRADPVHPLLGHITPDSTDQVARWRNILRLKEMPWLNGHHLQGQSVFPAAGYVALAIEASIEPWVVKEASVSLVEVTDLELGKALTFDSDDVDVEAVFTLGGLRKVGGKDGTKDTITAEFSYNASTDNQSTDLALLASGRVKITLGGERAVTPDTVAGALPGRGTSPPCLLSIPPDELYESLEKVGYQYAGPFRALSGLQRRLGFATGHIDRLETLPGLILHPAVLDAAFQSTFLARSVPYDGSIWALHVPTSIRSVRVDISVAKRAAAILNGESGPLSFDAIQPLDTDVFVGDVDIYDADTHHAMIQVQGLRCVPLAARGVDDDKEVFSTTVWDVAEPDANLIGKDFAPTRKQQQLACLLERVSIYYLRNLGTSVPADHPARSSSGPLSCLFHFAEDCVGQAESTSWPFWQPEWNHDTAEAIAQACGPFSHVVDVQLLKRVGEKLADIATNATQAIEVGMADGLLAQYYQLSLGTDTYTSFLGKTVKQIVHRHPHCHFLEIGAGTGGATRRVLAEIEQSYSSYTFTDVSSGFFPAAQEAFGQQHGVVYKTLDIEKAPADQGFRLHSYDVIVASMVLHATERLEGTLAHVRSLLRPGGYLVMLEGLPDVNVRLGAIFGAFPGWWAGQGDGRVLSPLVGVEQWDGLLRKTGFGGVDSATPILDPLVAPLVVMVAQATDERVALLREPLKSTENQLLENLVVISGGSFFQARLAEQIRVLLHPYISGQMTIMRSWSDVDVDKVAISDKTTVLSLSDLVEQETFFQGHGPTEAGWESLRGTLVRARTLLWVSTSRLDARPHANLMVGLLRPAPRELPTLDVQFLDFASVDIEQVDARVIAETLLRLRTTTVWQRDGVVEGGSASLLSTVESEIVINETGQAIIPRLMVDRAMNDRYNSSRRPIYETVRMADSRSRDPVVTLTPLDGDTGADGKYVLRKHELEPTSKEGSSERLLQVSYSSLRAHKTAESGHLFLTLGQQADDQVVFLSANRGSRVMPWDDFVIPINEIETGLEADFLRQVAHHLIASTVLRDLIKGDRILILGGSQEFTNVLQLQANKGGVLVNCINDTDIHPTTTERDMRNMIPTKVAVLVDLSPVLELIQIRRLLPRDCRIETEDTLYQRQASSVPWAYHTGEIRARLQDAVNHALYSLAKPEGTRTRPVVLTLAHIVSPDPDHTNRREPHAILDWVSTADIPVQITPIETHIALSSHKTYWLAGLSHGLGLSLSEWLFRHGARHIAISSRRPDIPTAWLARMAAAGASVHVFACDLADGRAVRDTHASICSFMPPVAGVAQGAMVLDDVSLPDMTLDQLTRVTAPKVRGSLNLHSLFGQTSAVPPLDFFVLFSSASSLVGYAGQGNYAAANLFMSSLAEQRRLQGLAASVMHIGPVLGVGYVTENNRGDEMRRRVEAGEGMFLSEHDFHQLFAEAIVAGRPTATVKGRFTRSNSSIQVATGLARIHGSKENKPSWASNPILGHFLRNNDDGGGGNSVNDRNAGGEVVLPLKTQLSQASSRDEVYVAILGAFLSKLSVLYRVPVQELAKEDPASLHLSEMGTDSLLAIEIRGWFLKTLHVNIPVLKVLSGATVRELVTTASETVPAAWIPLVKGDDDSKVGESAGIQVSAPVVTVCAPSEPAKTASAQQPEEEDEADGRSASDDQDCDRTSTPLDIGYGKDGFTVTAPSSVVSESGVDEKTINLSGALVFEETDPLSFSQAMFWFVLAFLQDKSSLNHTASFRLTGPLRLDAFERSLQAIGQQHSILRTCFFENEAGQPTQGVLPHSTIRGEYRTIQHESEVAAVVERLDSQSFDMAAGENLRVVLLTLTPTTHFLLLSSHSLVVDGASFRVFLEDLERHYLGLPLDMSQTTTTMDTPQYLSHAIKQLRAHKIGQHEADLFFWRSEFPANDFPDPLPILSLAHTTASRPVLNSYENTRADVRFRLETKAAIKALCRRCGATPFQFHLAVWRVLLARHAAADASTCMRGRDVAIGIADTNRTEQEDWQVMGPLVNLLPLRFNWVCGGDVFEDTLRDTSRKVLKVLGHAKVPFQVLLDELCAPRSASCTPIFQTLVDYRLGQREKTKWADCQLEMQSFQVSKIAYDLALDIIDDPDGDCLAMLIVRSDLYTQKDAVRLARSYELLVQAFAAHPGISINKPDVFDVQGVSRGLAFSSGPPLPSTWPSTIVHKIDEIMEMRQDHSAVRWDGDKVITYNELQGWTDTIALALLSSGVSPGSRVAVLQEPTADWIASILAILRTGAIYFPLDQSNPWERVATMVKDCQPTVVLVDQDTYQHVHKLAHSGLKAINISNLARSTQLKRPDITAHASSVAAILYTSGSSGTPKGIILKHEGFRNWLEWTAQIYHLHSDEIVLQQSSMGFDMSLIQVFTALCLGGQLVIVPRKLRGDARAITELINSAGITYTFTCTSELSTWFKYSSPTRLAQSRWRRAITGGEPGVDTLFAEFAAIDRPDLRLFHAYGPTEISWTATTTELPYRTLAHKHTSNIPVGQALPNYTVYVLDAQLNPVPPGVQGEIFIGGPGVAAGYLNNDGLTAERFIPDPFSAREPRPTLHRTGDLGRWGENGELFIEGRIAGDTQIKLRGLRIDLAEVERSLVEASAGAISEAVVSVRRHRRHPEQLQTRGTEESFLVAHVVLNPDYQNNHGSDVNQLISDGLLSRLALPRYMCPSVVIPLDRMPLTNTLKLDRRAIAQLELPESFSSDSEGHVQQLTEVEAQLKQLWKDVISDKIAGLHPTIRQKTDFFHVGGTSILLLDLRRRIHGQWGIDLSLVDMFDASTLATMARTIESLLGGQEAVTSPTSPNMINWDEETELPPDLKLLREKHQPAPPSRTKTRNNDGGLTILLTGATGYLGSALLRALISDPSISHIHCIAVRSPLSSSLPSSPKVTIHPGDLSHPTLGLSPQSESPTTTTLLSTIDAIIHNGAAVSYLKTYSSLRSPNLQSTKFLASLAAPRQIPIHYISSGSACSFAAAAGIEPVGPVSVAGYPPPGRDGPMLGYAASKWASEVFLEKLVGEFAGRRGRSWRVCIHRPSNISRTRGRSRQGRGGGKGQEGGDGADSSMDLVHNLIGYSREIGAVPRMNGVSNGGGQQLVQGVLDSVSLEKVVQGVVDAVVGRRRAGKRGEEEEEERSGSNLEFLHHLGGVELAMDDLGRWVGMEGTWTNGKGEDNGQGGDLVVLDLAEWTRRAAERGMNPALVTFLQMFGSTSGMVFPRLVN